MAVPSVATFSIAAKVAAHTAFRDLVDTGPSAGYIDILDANDVLLVTVALAVPGGTVDAETAQLTLLLDGPGEAVASGTAAYAELYNGSDNLLLTLLVKEGAGPASWFLVLNATTIVQGAAVSIVSAVMG